MSAKQNSFKFAWERAVGTTRYVASVKQVARVLSGYAHLDGSNARPGVDRIMAECSLKRSAVLAAIQVLAEDDWIAKAPRSGVKRDYFDSYQLTMPAWLTDPDAERPDSRREAERAAVAERMREERRAAKAAADQVRMYGPNQIQTYGPDVEINWGDHTEGLGPYTGPDQVHTSGRLGPYTVEEAAGQGATRITNRTTLKNNHGAPVVAGAPRAPLAAGPLVPHGVELADARSERDEVPAAESTGPVAVRRKKLDKPFRNESDAYVAAAKKLDWDTVKDALAKWKAARGDEYDWARDVALGKMGNAGKNGLKTSRGFQRADRLTLDAALRMHLDDGNWHEALTEPLAVTDLPLTPLAINDLKDVRRRADLDACFETIRRMSKEETLEFGRRFKAEYPRLFDVAVEATVAEMELLPGRGADPLERNRIACMQMFNTTKDWPRWMTDAVRPQESAWGAA